MPWPRCPLQHVLQALYLDEGGEAFRIDLLDQRREDEINAEITADFLVALKWPRITAQVFLRAKLCRIDEDRHDNESAIVSSRTDERSMALVQRSHRRHQANHLAGRTSSGNGLA